MRLLDQTFNQGHKYTRNMELPGLVVYLLEGPYPLPSDVPFGNGALLFASEARGLLENLQPAHVRKGGVSKALSLENVEERLEMVLRIRGEEGLNALRDQAREVAALEWPTELALLQRIADARPRAGAALRCLPAGLIHHAA